MLSSWLSWSRTATLRASASVIVPRFAATNNDDGVGGALVLAELAKEAEENASCAHITQTLTDEDRSFVLSLCVQFSDKDDKDISTAMMGKISRRLDAMPLRLIMVLLMVGESLEWLEQDGGGRGGGGGTVWGGNGGMGASSSAGLTLAGACSRSCRS
jgi:hypothetical protein